MIQDISELAACSRSYGGSELSGNRFFLQRPHAGTPSGSLPEALSPPSRPGPRGSSFSWVSRLRVHHQCALRILNFSAHALHRSFPAVYRRLSPVEPWSRTGRWLCSGPARQERASLLESPAGILKIDQFLQAKDLKICPHRNKTKTFFIAKQTHRRTHEPVGRSNKKGKKVSGTQLRKHEFLICTELLYITQTAG